MQDKLKCSFTKGKKLKRITEKRLHSESFQTEISREFYRRREYSFGGKGKKEEGV
jgi:hypothetical protein